MRSLEAVIHAKFLVGGAWQQKPFAAAVVPVVPAANEQVAVAPAQLEQPETLPDMGSFLFEATPFEPRLPIG